MAFLNGYTNRIRLTIDHTKVGETLTDFPVRVSLTSSNLDFSKANSDGFDFRFTSDDGYTLLKYERELHDSANSLAEYWVKIPSVSSSVDTIFFLYYRTTDTADGADPENVWNANYKMVQHLKDNTTSSTLDSTANNIDGTKQSANHPAVTTSGAIASAQNFDGTSDYITTPLPVTAYPFTLSAIVKVPSVVSGQYQILGLIDESATNVYYHIWLRANYFRIVARNPDNDELTNKEPAGDHIGEFMHIAGVFASDTSRIIYVNGVASAEDTSSVAFSANTDKGIMSLARLVSPVSYWPGIIDETRISNDAKSTSWLLADYNSVFDTLLTKSAESLTTMYIAVGGVWKEVETVVAKMS